MESNEALIPTSDLKPGDVIVRTERGYNFKAEHYFHVVNRWQVVAIDEPAPVLIGVAAGQVRTTVHVRRLMDGRLGQVREQSLGETVNVER